MDDQVQSVDEPRDDLPSAGEDVAKLRLELSDKPLRELVKDGLIKLDMENNVVKEGPNFEKGRPLKS